jgi:rod shape-determining protein MreD
LIYAGVLLLAAMVESTIGYRLDVTGGRLNLVLALVVAWGLERSFQAGVLAGLVGGLALDLVSGTPFGLHTLLLGWIGGAAALGEATMARGGLGMLFGTAVLATVAYHVITVLVLRVFGWDWPGGMRLVNILVPTIFLNAIFMPFAAVFARRIERSFTGWGRLELE